MLPTPSTPNSDFQPDGEYFASLLALDDAASQRKPSKRSAPVSRDGLMGAFSLLEKALGSDDDSQVERLLSQAQSKLSRVSASASPSKFERQSLRDLVDAARRPIPMINGCFTPEGSARSIVPLRELTWISAEPASGKSFLVTAQMMANSRSGNHSVFIDFESTGEVITRRLLQVGCTDDELDRISYMAPAAGWSATELQAIVAQAVAEVVETRANLLVLDGFAQAATRLGLSENDNGEMALFAAALSSIAYETGCAVVVIDHIGKEAAANGSRYARGASSKLAQPSNAFRVKVVDAPNIGKSGRIELISTKDRHGVVAPEGSTAAVVLFEPQDREIEGGVDLRIVSPDSSQGAMFPDKTMMMIGRRLHSAGSMSKTDLRNMRYDRGEREGEKCFSRQRFTGTVEPIMDWLVRYGHVAVETTEKGGGTVYRWVGQGLMIDDVERIKFAVQAEDKGIDPAF